jgi:hypothetical protein
MKPVAENLLKAAIEEHQKSAEKVMIYYVISGHSLVFIFNAGCIFQGNR